VTRPLNLGALRCPTCKGRGRIQVGPSPTVNYGHAYGLTCTDCRECPTCLGDGQTMGYGALHACERCDGTGRVAMSFIVDADGKME
jgi:DnaJ-class molecular chaperone